MSATGISTLSRDLLRERIDFRYENLNDLFQQLDDTFDDSVTVGGVASAQFDQIYTAMENRGRKFRLSFYLANAKVLIITVPRLPHENLHRTLDDKISGKAMMMRLDDELVATGAATFRYKDNTGNLLSSLEGDSARKPISLRPTEDHYPTLVIEAGFTQSWNSLRIKARAWFASSRHQVKIVLLVKLDRNQRRITFEMWKEFPPPLPPETRRVTRSASDLQPRCAHTIHITRDAGVNDVHQDRFNPASYNVIGGPLQLGFADIFLRQPVGQEADIIISNAELISYAITVWKAVHH
ncbi:hypothetical protein B7463_g9873, partial [Scytalidium lignicola]